MPITSKVTPRCSWKVSVAGLPTLEFNAIHRLNLVSRLCYLAKRPGFCSANLLEVENLRVLSFVAS